MQRPFYPEVPCHLYSHPPGGVVGGDELDVQIKVEQEAHALLTTLVPPSFIVARGHNRRSQRPSNWRKVPLWSGYRKINILFPGATCNC